MPHPCECRIFPGNPLGPVKGNFDHSSWIFKSSWFVPWNVWDLFTKASLGNDVTAGAMSSSPTLWRLGCPHLFGVESWAPLTPFFPCQSLSSALPLSSHRAKEELPWVPSTSCLSPGVLLLSSLDPKLWKLFPLHALLLFREEFPLSGCAPPPQADRLASFLPANH